MEAVTEGVDVRQGARVGFGVQLPRDGKVRAAAEKVLGVVRIPIRVFGQPRHCVQPLLHVLDPGLQR